MVDPTSDLEEDVNEESAPRCGACGAPVLGFGRRTVTWVADDGIEHRHFCNDECRRDWNDERPAAR